ncbi:MAG: TonB-dependent receptor, partial [Sphingomonadales bacterium]|nr:TonB-dependent receptor [Sphingomonadales bacterium]
MSFISFKALSTVSTLALLMSPSLAWADDQQRGHEEHDTMEELVVTASAVKRARFDVLQSTAVMSGEELARNMGTTLGDTLDALPGVSNTYFGPGAGRPIIRGLGGDRIRVLTGGIGAIDASSTSPDHAVASDPLTAQSIEVVRGPATLLYGNNAVGGVVNVLDGRIPYARPESKHEGVARIAYGTNANDLALGAAATFMASENTALHLEAAWRDAGNMSVPSYLRSAELRAEDPLHEGEVEEQKIAENSNFDTLSTSLGGTRFFEGGYFGVALSYSENNYGVPAGAHHHGDEDEAVAGEEEHEDIVRIDLEQWRFDLMGQVDLSGFFQTARVRFGYGDYKHRELEGAEVGTTFLNEGYEGRVELVQAENGHWSGAMGVQFRSRDFEAIGLEAFTPPSRTRQLGVFILEEYNADRWTAEAGARFELQDVQSNTTGARRSYDGV